MTSPDMVSAMAAFDDGDLLVAIATQNANGGPPVKSTIQRRAQADGKAAWSYVVQGQEVPFVDVARDGRIVAALSDGVGSLSYLLLNADGTVRKLVSAPLGAAGAPHFDVNALVWLPPFTLDDTGMFNGVRVSNDATWVAAGAFDVEQFIVASGAKSLTDTSFRGVELTGATKWERPLTFTAMADTTLLNVKVGPGQQAYVRFDGSSRDGGAPSADLGCDAGAPHWVTALSASGTCLWTVPVARPTSPVELYDLSPSAQGLVLANQSQVVELDAQDGHVLQRFDAGVYRLTASQGATTIYAAQGTQLLRLR